MRGTVYVVTPDGTPLRRFVAQSEYAQSDRDFKRAALVEYLRSVRVGDPDTLLEFGPIGPSWRKEGVV